jgi:hypothetical protein
MVSIPYSTFAAAGGNVAPSSGIDAADIRIYRAADSGAISATQRSSAAGITSTSPFDSLTGFHTVDIDLTDNTDAGFYASGYRYFIVFAPNDETIDSQTITGVAIAMFEIGVPTANVTQFGGAAGTFASGIPEVKVASLAAAAIASIWAQVVSTGFSALQILRLNAAALGGKTSGAGTATITIRNIIDTVDAIVIGTTGPDRTTFTFDLSA